MIEKDFEALYRKYGRSSYTKMGLIEKIKKVILSPSEFFEKIKKEKGIGEAFKYLAVLSLVPLAVNLIAFQLDVTYISSIAVLSTLIPFLAPIVNILAILIPIIIYVIGLVLSFIGVGFIHLFAKLLKGKGEYSSSYKALIYASTPSILLGWIPWVGIIFGLYSFYLSLKGISKLHEVSMGRAFVILFVIPFIIIVVITIALAGIAYMYIASLFAGKVGGPSLGPTAKLLEAVDSSCLNGNANIWIRNIGTSSITSTQLSVTKDNTQLTYGEFTVDKFKIGPGETATIIIPCTTPGTQKTCRYTIEELEVNVFCF